MRACLLTDVQRLEIREVPTPVPAPHEVLVKVGAVGLCGTDFHIYAGHGNYHTDERGRPIPFAQHPLVLGHEIAGVVAETGAQVSDLHPGTRVIIDQGLNCHSAGVQVLCEYCGTGDSHQCERFAEMGITGPPGGFADYVRVPAVNVVQLRGALPLGEAVFSEPLACVLHAFEALGRTGARYGLPPKATSSPVRAVLVLGAGPSGLLFVQVLRRVLRFDGPLLVSEPNPRRRALAAQFGAEVIDPTTTDLLDAVMAATRGRGVECLIDAAGRADLYPVMPSLLRKQGTVMLYAHGLQGADLGVLDLLKYKEPTFLAPVGASGGFDERGRPLAYRAALALLEEERIAAAPLATHRYDGLARIPTAFAEEHHRGATYVKGIVELS